MTNEILGKLKGPSIGLIVTAGLNAMFGLYLMASSLIQHFAGMAERDFTSSAERTGFYVGFWGIAILGLVSVLLAPVIIVGAIKMMKGQSYGFAKATAILSIIPLTSCCFVVGMPFGIWALVVLYKPEVIAFFNGEIPSRQYYPPQPPRSW